jgi:hypothetical protein
MQGKGKYMDFLLQRSRKEGSLRLLKSLSGNKKAGAFKTPVDNNADKN